MNFKSVLKNMVPVALGVFIGTILVDAFGGKISGLLK